MRRLLANLLTALSLLLCLATAALWVRSYFVQDWFQYQHTDAPGRRWTSYTFVSGRGALYVSRPWFVFTRDGLAEAYAKQHPDPEGYSYKRLPPSGDVPRDTFLNRLGFYARLSDRSTDPDYVMGFPRAFFPHWFVVLLTATLPALRGASHFRRRSRRRENHCPDCGYDLRATPERCPECGREAPAPA